MNYARTLLQLRQIPIKNVAELCGYRNAKFFSREYHKKFGIAPSEDDRIIR
jgi:transcriptional regulator GlxA family with amidase domain